MDHIIAHFTRLRRHARETDAEMPPRVSIITLKLCLAIERLADSTRQRVSRYIIHDHGKGRTGSQYKGEHGVDMIGNHRVIGKAIKALKDRGLDDKSSSEEEERRKRKKGCMVEASGAAARPSHSASGSTKALCFLCVVRGHRGSTRQVGGAGILARGAPKLCKDRARYDEERDQLDLTYRSGSP